MSGNVILHFVIFGILSQVMFIYHYLFTLVLKSPDGEWPITYTFTFTFTTFLYNLCRLGDLMLSALDSKLNAPGSSSDGVHCVVFLGKTLCSFSVSFHPGV